MIKRNSAVSPWIYSALQVQYGQVAAEHMAKALMEANFPQPPTVLCDRIHIAIVKEAGGDLVRFVETLKRAKVDWRAVVKSADLDKSKWCQELNAIGIFPPPAVCS